MRSLVRCAFPVAALAVAVAALAVASAALAGAPRGPASTRASSAQPGAGAPWRAQTLIVAMSGSYWPLHDETADGGRTGLEADLAGALASLHGLHLRFVGRNETGTGAVEAVASGKADIAISSITPTDERRKLVDFTKPYLVLHYRFAGRKGSASAALDPSGKLIAVPRGPAVAVVKGLFPRATTMEVPSPDSAARAALSGHADLAFGEDVGIVLAIQGRELELVGPQLAESPLAVAVPKGLAKHYDDELARLSGRIAWLAEAYRPGEAPELPGEIHLRFTGEGYYPVVHIQRKPLAVSFEQLEGAVESRSIGHRVEVVVRRTGPGAAGTTAPRAPALGRVVAKPPAAVLRRAKESASFDAPFDAPDAQWVALADGTFIGFAVGTERKCGKEYGNHTSFHPCSDIRHDVVVLVRGDEAASAVSSTEVPDLEEGDGDPPE